MFMAGQGWLTCLLDRIRGTLKREPFLTLFWLSYNRDLFQRGLGFRV